MKGPTNMSGTPTKSITVTRDQLLAALRLMDTDYGTAVTFTAPLKRMKGGALETRVYSPVGGWRPQVEVQPGGGAVLAGNWRVPVQPRPETG